ncbi:hypothetical protein BJY00DRAFT_295566 [Aspergillus carlsbadensis]|nr:hypothetical protein BJY00DRAFT_295566 [Aspergillus carlsbadensis]
MTVLDRLPGLWSAHSTRNHPLLVTCHSTLTAVLCLGDDSKPEQRVDIMAKPNLAAKIIAATDLSIKVAALCDQYSKHARNTSGDIDHLHQEVTNLQTGSETLTNLLNSPDSGNIEASQELSAAVDDSLVKLQRLEQELSPGITRKVLSRVGLRTLRWPLSSNDAHRAAQDLDHCKQGISLASQMTRNQTHVPDADDLKYFVRTDWQWPRSNPAGFLRTYQTNTQTESGQATRTYHEGYNFSKPGWERTTFFLDYNRGHVDYEFEEVPVGEAERLIHVKLRRKYEREYGG